MTSNQRKVITDYLNTVSAAWLAAGAIAPIFTGQYSQIEFRASIVSGIAGSLALLFISLIIIDRN